jgi:hypothetical protein
VKIFYFPFSGKLPEESGRCVGMLEQKINYLIFHFNYYLSLFIPFSIVIEKIWLIFSRKNVNILVYKDEYLLIVWSEAIKALKE